MPGRDWRDVVGGVASPDSIPLPADLARLMEQRQALEQRMQSLTGGENMDSRTAALYQVRPMAERIAEHRDWQRSREDATRRAAGQAGERARDEREQSAERLEVRGTPRPAEAMPLRPTSAERDRLRQRQPSEAESFLAGRDLVSGLGGVLGRFDVTRALDRKMKGSGAEKLAGGVEKLQRLIDRSASTMKAPERAERVIDEDWLKRRDQVGGPDLARYEQGFRKRAERLFGEGAGESLANLQERTEGLREQVMGRRREERGEAVASARQSERARQRREARRQAEQGDEDRRQRAVQRRRERGDE